MPLTLRLVHEGRIGMLDALARVTAAPAGILRLEAGRLAKGAPADLTIFDPDLAWRIDPDRFRSKSKNSPFDDYPTRGRARATVVDGRIIYAVEGFGG